METEVDAVEHGVGPDVDAPAGAFGAKIVAVSTTAAMDDRRIALVTIDRRMESSVRMVRSLPPRRRLDAVSITVTFARQG